MKLISIMTSHTDTYLQMLTYVVNINRDPENNAEEIKSTRPIYL